MCLPYRLKSNYLLNFMDDFYFGVDGVFYGMLLDYYFAWYSPFQYISIIHTQPQRISTVFENGYQVKTAFAPNRCKSKKETILDSKSKRKYPTKKGRAKGAPHKNFGMERYMKVPPLAILSLLKRTRVPHGVVCQPCGSSKAYFFN